MAETWKSSLRSQGDMPSGAEWHLLPHPDYPLPQSGAPTLRNLALRA